MEEMIQKLLSRAKQSLYNRSEVTQEIATQAMQEALELTANKTIPTANLMDLAMFRLMLLLKVEPSEVQIMLAQNAIKAAQALKNSDGTGGGVAYGSRKSEIIE